MRRLRLRERLRGARPPTSWIITLHNERAGATRRVQAALARLDPGDTLVVVDAGSTDGTADVVFDALAADPRLLVVATEAGTDQAARVGAAHAPHRARSFDSGVPVQASGLDGSVLAEPLVQREPPAAAAVARTIMMPAAAYHLEELGPLADELERRGRPCAFYATGWRWKHVARPLRRQRQPVLDWDGPGEWVDGAAAIVTLNDWGEPLRDIVERANSRGIPTFAKVEGVQDFDDLDVHWDRQAYRTAAIALCQGHNDQQALAGRPTVTVGNSRLERIWSEPPSAPDGVTAVINLNFTYGVMEEARDAWLADAVAAATAAGLQPVVSRHPAEHAPVEGVAVATEPMAHLLTAAAVLITRFSTVPFEAIARGTPFVYYNPHGERVPTFLDPRGAFESATNREELTGALIRSAALDRSQFRRRAAAFFEDQIDIDPDRSSAERAADAIMAAIDERAGGTR